MDEEERKHIETIIKEYARRLRVLEVFQAKQGNDTSPGVIIEIEDIQEKLAELRGRMQRGPIVTVDVVAFPGAATSAGPSERIDWTAAFSPALPSSEVWANELLPAITGLKQRLAERREHVIALRPKAHLSIGYAFGYVFRATTGFQLWVEQPIPNSNQTQWWRTDDAPILGTPLEQERITRRVRGTDTSIEINVAPNHDIRVVVEQCIRQWKLPVRERIMFRPSAYLGSALVPNGQHALAMAQQIRAAIRAALNLNPHQTIHLFGAMPIGLAVLLGAHLNACEPIQCYEFDRDARVYQPACILKSHL